MFNKTVKEDIERLRKHVLELDSQVFKAGLSIFSYKVSRIAKLESDICFLKAQLKKQQALLNEVIDFVYSKEENK